MLYITLLCCFEGSLWSPTMPCTSGASFNPMQPLKYSPSQLLYCACFNFTQGWTDLLFSSCHNKEIVRKSLSLCLGKSRSYDFWGYWLWPTVNVYWHLQVNFPFCETDEGQLQILLQLQWCHYRLSLIQQQQKHTACTVLNTVVVI